MASCTSRTTARTLAGDHLEHAGARPPASSTGSSVATLELPLHWQHAAAPPPREGRTGRQAVRLSRKGTPARGGKRRWRCRILPSRCYRANRWAATAEAAAPPAAWQADRHCIDRHCPTGSRPCERRTHLPQPAYRSLTRRGLRGLGRGRTTLVAALDEGSGRARQPACLTSLSPPCRPRPLRHRLPQHRHPACSSCFGFLCFV